MLAQLSFLCVIGMIAASPQVLTPPRPGLEQEKIDTYREVWFYTCA